MAAADGKEGEGRGGGGFRAGSRDAHLLDELRQDGHLVYGLAGRGLVHLHADLGDLHGSGDDDLASAGHAAGKALERKVSVRVHLRVVDLRKARVNRSVFHCVHAIWIQPETADGKSHFQPA